jgi:hypothetical protein
MIPAVFFNYQQGCWCCSFAGNCDRRHIAITINSRCVFGGRLEETKERLIFKISSNMFSSSLREKRVLSSASLRKA